MSELKYGDKVRIKNGDELFFILENKDMFLCTRSLSFFESGNYRSLKWFEDSEKFVEKSYEEKQEKWVSENDIEVGGFVKVIGKSSKENFSIHLAVLDDYVGDELEVLEIIRNSILLAGYSGHKRRFPYFSLEKVVKTYVEKQAEWIVQNDIKVGDMIKVIGESSRETYGCHVVELNDFAGKTLEVVFLKDQGIGLNCLGHENWIFPYFMLEKVVPRPFTMEEFKEFRDCWFTPKNCSTNSIKILRCEKALLSRICNGRVETFTYLEFLEDFTFEDGSPCGVIE